MIPASSGWIDVRVNGSLFAEAVLPGGCGPVLINKASGYA